MKDTGAVGNGLVAGALALVISSATCPRCKGWKGSHYVFCRRCTARLPGIVQYDLRNDATREKAYLQALDILGMGEREAAESTEVRSTGRPPAAAAPTNEGAGE